MAFAALLSFAPAIILLQFCFNPLYKLYSLKPISEPAFFSLKYIKYCISCITVYTYTIKNGKSAQQAGLSSDYRPRRPAAQL